MLLWALGQQVHEKQAATSTSTDKPILGDSSAAKALGNKVPLPQRSQVQQLEHLAKLYERGDVPRVGWLDKLAFEVGWCCGVAGAARTLERLLTDCKAAVLRASTISYILQSAMPCLAHEQGLLAAVMMLPARYESCTAVPNNLTTARNLSQYWQRN